MSEDAAAAADAPAPAPAGGGMGDLQSLLAAVSEDCNQKHKEIQKTTKNMRRKSREVEEMLSNITDSSLKAMAGLKREDESMEDLFKRIDTDKSGLLDSSEIEKAMVSVKQASSMSNNDIRRLMLDIKNYEEDMKKSDKEVDDLPWHEEHYQLTLENFTDFMNKAIEKSSAKE